MICGILPVDKPSGITSHRVSGEIKKLVNIKTGHSGTLDPEASGVLPVLLGRATKLADFLPTNKAYRAILLLGTKTSTGDITGEVTERNDTVIPCDVLRLTAQRFVGEINQIPPMYSALKVDGKKLYELARKGVEIERKSRKITIYNLQIGEKLSDFEYEIFVSCSKGTYIRTLCEDIAAACGTVGTMKSLRRTHACGIDEKACIPLEDFKAMPPLTLENHIITPEECFCNLNSVFFPDNSTKYLLNGGKIEQSRVRTADIEACLSRAYGEDGKFLGLVSLQDGFYKTEWLSEENS